MANGQSHQIRYSSTHGAALSFMLLQPVLAYVLSAAGTAACRYLTVTVYKLKETLCQLSASLSLFLFWASSTNQVPRKRQIKVCRPFPPMNLSAFSVISHLDCWQRCNAAYLTMVWNASKSTWINVYVNLQGISDSCNFFLGVST